MKKSLFLMCCFSGSTILAQPVIQDGSNRVAAGFTSPVGVSTAATTPGSAGPSQSWDYSALSFSQMGTMTVIDPTTSAYAASFGAANFCFTISAGGNTMYTYRNYSPAKMEELASSIPAPGSGQDYSPNPATRLIFPMSMGTTATDTWQKVGDSPNQVTVTYDAYGTFITPYNTYTDVVRVANDFGNNEVDYSWFITNPLRLLAVHKHSDNTIVLLDGANVMSQPELLSGISLAPNPATHTLFIDMPDGTNTCTLQLFSLSGARITKIAISGPEVQLDRENIPAGAYFYTLSEGHATIGSGKLLLL